MNSSDQDNDEVRESKRKEPTTQNSSLPPKRKVSVRSEVWKHFTRLTENNDKCKCHYCGKIFCCDTRSRTNALKKHLDICKIYAVFKESNSHQIITIDGTDNMRPMIAFQEAFREATNKMINIGELPPLFY